MYTIYAVIIQDNHPVSRFAVRSTNPLFPRKVTFTGFLTRMWGPYCEWIGELEDGCWWAGRMLESRVDLTLVKGSDTSGSLPPPLWRTLLFDRGERIMWVEKAFEAALFYWKVYTSPCFPSLWRKGFTIFWRFMQKLHSVWSPLSFVDEAGIFGSCWNSLEFWVPSNPEQCCRNSLFFFLLLLKVKVWIAYELCWKTIFIIFSLLVQHEIIMVKKQHVLSFDTQDIISAYGFENSLNHLATWQVLQCLLELEKEHEIDINGTDTLWGETGNYGSPACSWGQVAAWCPRRHFGPVVLRMTWDASGPIVITKRLKLRAFETSQMMSKTFLEASAIWIILN